MKTALTVMAGLVPAIRSGRVPRLMAGTSPAIAVNVTRKANRISYECNEEIPIRYALRWRMTAVGLPQPVCLLF
jgi:hypothetical protein